MVENLPLLPKERKNPTKKILIIVLIIFFILIGTGVLSFYLYEKKIKSDLINFLPLETNAYLRIRVDSQNPQVKNLKELLNKFPYYQKISEKIDQEFEKMKNENYFLKNLDFTISKEVILALIPPIEKEKEPSFILLLPNPDLKKIEKLTKDFEKMISEKKDWKIEKENYKGRTIVKAKSISSSKNSLQKESEFALVMSDGNFLFSFETSQIKKIIDVIEEQKLINIFKPKTNKNLNENLEYLKIKNYLPKDYLILFYSEFDLTRIFKTTGFGELAEDKLPTQLMASLKTVLNLPFLKGNETNETEKLIVAGAIIADKEGLKSEGYYLDLREDAVLPSTFSIDNSLTNFLPDRIGQKDLVYYSEGRDLKTGFEQLEKATKERLGDEEKKEFENFLKEIEKEIGINLKEDLLPFFEGNFAFFISAEMTGKEKPVIGLVFEIGDEEKAKENLLKIKLPKIPELSPSDIFGLESSRKRAKDARIMSDMYQLRAMAEMIYDDEESYRNVKCTYKSTFIDLKIICQDIKEQVGFEPTIYQTKDKYCAYTKLNTTNQYYCIDSAGTAIGTYINPGQTNYCTGKTFVCPKTVGTPPSEEITLPEMVSFSKEILDNHEIYSLPFFDDLGLFFSIKEKRLIFTLNKESLIEILGSLNNPGQKKLRESQVFSEQFQSLPQNLTEISYIYPYGFSGIIKYAANFAINIFYGLDLSDSEMMPPPESFVSLVFEFLDKGVLPYLKVLNSGSSYSYSPEKGLIISRGKLIIKELPEQEKIATENFWENIQDWLEEKMSSIEPAY